MKVLIWVGFILVVSVVNTLFRLGVIPMLLLYLAAFYAARALCKAWDEKKKGTVETERPAEIVKPGETAQPARTNEEKKTDNTSDARV